MSGERQWVDSTDDGSAVSRLLEDARSGVDRVEAEDLAIARDAGALVVDMRPLEQRRRDGDLPGAVVVGRNVLEWRLDPTSPHRLPIADDPDRRVVLVCDEGYSSSLAAHSLRRLGLVNATDLVGGFQAWLALVADDPSLEDESLDEQDDRHTDPVVGDRVLATERPGAREQHGPEHEDAQGEP